MTYIYMRRVRGVPRAIEVEDIVTKVVTHPVVCRAVWNIWEWDLLDDGVRISPRAAKDIGFPEDVEPDHLVGIPGLPQVGIPMQTPVRFNVDPDLPDAVALVVDSKHPEKFPARCVVFYEDVPRDDVPEDLLNFYRNELDRKR